MEFIRFAGVRKWLFFFFHSQVELEQWNFSRSRMQQTCRSNDHELTISASGDWHLFISFWFHFLSLNTQHCSARVLRRIFFFSALWLHSLALSSLLPSCFFVVFNFILQTLILYRARCWSAVTCLETQEKWASGSRVLTREISRLEHWIKMKLRVKHETLRSIKKVHIIQREQLSQSTLLYELCCRTLKIVA